jgi:ankyrin repeat protein
MAVHIAAFQGRLDIVRYIVGELGADVNQAAQGGATPLYIAALNGRLGIVQCLVGELGADVKRTDKDGSTPLHIAAESGHVDVLRCLVNDCGADVNQAMPDGATSLYVAVHGGRVDAVRYLLCELGADVNHAKNDGFTPLMCASADPQGRSCEGGVRERLNGDHSAQGSRGDRLTDRVPGGAGVLRQRGLRRRRKEALLCVQGDAVLRDGLSGRALACASGGLPAADRRRERRERSDPVRFSCERRPASRNLLRR